MMIRKLLLWLSLFFLCCACAGGPRSAPPAARVEPAATSQPATPLVEFAQVSRQLAATPAPPGVNAALWRQLKDELSRVLQARAAGKLASSAGRRASAAGLAALSYDATYNTLNWRYNFDGDYDQNSQVNVSDLTPLGLYFLQAGPFGDTTQQWLVDGDGNELINISDITPLGRYFGAQMSGYNIYVRPNASDYPVFDDLSQSYGASTVAPLAFVPYAQHTAQAGLLHAFTYPLVDSLWLDYCWVRPTDGTTEGAPSDMLQLPAPPNNEPSAALNALPLSGDAPLTVDFDASYSSDTDGSIVKYEWDWDGATNGWSWFDSATDATVQHTYDVPGIYTPVVRVTDDGGASNTTFITITAGTAGNEPPVAALTADPTSGPATLIVDFDASGSSDPDYNIAKFEWDFDGDGTFEVDSGLLNTAQHQYTNDGSFNATVRVSDSDGLSDTASQLITLETTTPQWHVQQPVPDSHVDHLSLAVVDGKPAIAYTTYNESDELRYVGADDPLGAAWGASALVVAEDTDWLRLLVSGGRAGVAYVNAGDEHFEWVYAQDAAASSWLAPQNITSIGMVSTEYCAAVIGGCPAVACTTFTPYGFVYIRATSSSGNSWSAPKVVYADYIDVSYMAEVDGRPAIGLQDTSGELSYVRANNVFGTDWPALTKITPPCKIARNPSLAVIDGQPALVYADDDTPRLCYVRASDASGVSWPEAQTIASGENWTGRTALAVVGGKPAVCFADGLPLTLYYMQADDALGTSWGPRQPLASGGITADCLIEAAGQPAIAYLISDVPSGEQTLHYAAYY